MIYRIDLQHFLIHAIDHFGIDQLSHFQYVIISASVKNGGTSPNIHKINELYPPPEMVVEYAETEDLKVLEKMYFEFLSTDEHGKKSNWSSNIIYKVFIENLINHYDLMIICDKNENPYIDVLCNYLEKMFSIAVIDLNQLFSKGYVGSIYIDRSKIWDRAVDIRRAAGKEEVDSLRTTRDGRISLIKKMRRKEKLKLLKELGIRVTARDKDHLDELLIEEWANELQADDEY